MFSQMLLAAARSGGAFTPPATTPSVFVVVPGSENVGWVEIPYPAAATFGSRTFFGWIDGANGDVQAAYYDRDTDTTSTLFVLHAALGGEGTADNHDNPAFAELADGRVIAAYCRHAGSAILMRIWDPDTDTWGTEFSIDRGNQHDYPTWFRVDGTLWLLFRNTTTGQNANLCYVRATSEVAGSDPTFEASATAVYNGKAGHTPYWRLWHDALTGFIHAVITEDTLQNLGHFYIDTADDTLHESDGTLIVDATPLLYASITPIVTATTVQCWGVTTDASGNVYAIYMLHGSSDNAIRRAVYTSSWATEEIVSTVGGQLGINQTGSGCAIDPLDPDRVWFPIKISSIFEMHEYRKVAGVWSGTQLTSGSSEDQVWPHATFASDGTIDVIWQSETDYTNDTTFADGAIAAYGTG